MSQLIICDPRSPEPWSDSALHNHGVKPLSPTTEIPTIGAKRILEPKFSPTAEIPNMNTKRDLEAKYSPTAEIPTRSATQHVEPKHSPAAEIRVMEERTAA